MPKFEKYLQQRRLDLGLPQALVARELGFKTTQQLANIEGGRAPFPAKYMKRLSRILKIKVGELVVLKVNDFTDHLVKEIQEG